MKKVKIRKSMECCCCGGERGEGVKRTYAPGLIRWVCDVCWPEVQAVNKFEPPGR